jgi:hypothetical protein
MRLGFNIVLHRMLVATGLGAPNQGYGNGSGRTRAVFVHEIQDPEAMPAVGRRPLRGRQRG